jgi:RluA family pseudouridine synthase
MKIIFQNSEFLAVDKPPGISVHNTEDPENLIGLLKEKYKNLFPVHRLDKETSGIQVLALNEKAARDLAQEFQNRKVKKIYIGIVRGSLKNQDGSWTQPITDKAEGRKNPQGLTKDRVAAETLFRVTKTSKFFTLVEFHLITGRQHQIRKHCSLAKHALVGDGRYGEPSYNKKMAQIYKFDRMFLHCHKLEISGQNLISPVPDEFEQLFRGNEFG